MTPQEITLPNLVYNLPYQYEVAPFQDSLDPSYQIGVCGEKRITLDPGTPSFVHLEIDAIDPIQGNFKIIYDEAVATLADIGETLINYTVSSVEYESYGVLNLTGSFFMNIIDNPTDIKPPRFTAKLDTMALLFGSSDSWSLTEVQDGTFPITDVEVEMSSNIAILIHFDESTRKFIFNGGSQKQDKNIFGNILIKLKDGKGNEA